VGFAPDQTKAFFSVDGTVPAYATACLDCGELRVEVDPKKLQALVLGKSDT
jgi:hypothetical protein